jgi:hypothetical protein
MRFAWLALLFVSACAHAPPPDIDRISGPGYEGVLFSAEYARRTYFLSGTPRLWTPTRTMVADFERRLLRYLRSKQIQLESPTKPRLRQYLGILEYRTGRRLMRAALFCPDVYRETGILMDVTDVYGDCDCTAWYDPRSKSILEFGCSMKRGLLRYPDDRGLPPRPPEPPSTGEPTPPSNDRLLH